MSATVGRGQLGSGGWGHQGPSRKVVVMRRRDVRASEVICDGAARLHVHPARVVLCSAAPSPPSDQERQFSE